MRDLAIGLACSASVAYAQQLHTEALTQYYTPPAQNKASADVTSVGSLDGPMADRTRESKSTLVHFLLALNPASEFASTLRVHDQKSSRRWATQKSRIRRTPAVASLTTADIFPNVFAAYEAAAESNSLLTDVFTAGSINVVSDSIAQFTERQIREQTSKSEGLDTLRSARFGAYGLADGALSHVWFEGLDKIVGDDGTALQTVFKVAGDALVYTPLWCIWFLAAFVVLEAGDIRTIPSVVRADWLELFQGNLGFFLPLTGLIYGFVPREERVLAFGVASLIYTSLLSLWNSGRDELTSSANERAVWLPNLFSFRTRKLLVMLRRDLLWWRNILRQS